MCESNLSKLGRKKLGGSGGVRRTQPCETPVKSAEGKGMSKCQVPEPGISLAWMRKKKKVNAAAAWRSK